MTAEATPARSSERKPDAPSTLAPTTAGPVAEAATVPGWMPGGPMHRLRPPQVGALQAAAGNGAVGRLLGHDGSGIQRAPARPTEAAKPGRSVDSYVDLLNAFQDLAAAYINKGGAGLGAVKFGKDLTSAHRSLLWGIRRTLGQAVEKDPDSRKQASAGWRYVSAKLLAAVEEARTLSLPAAPLAAVSDQIAMINKRLGRARRADVPEEESVDSYNDVLRAVRDLLWQGTRLREGSIGIQREEVPGRKDVEISSSLRELNQKHRDLIAKVHLGSDLIGRHRTLLEKLRSALLAAHSEAAGSAFKALQLWRSIEGELRYVLQRAVTFGEGEIDIGPLLKLMDEVAAKLAQHYSAVHQENLQGLLSKQRAVGDVKARKKVAEAVGGKAAVAALQESISIEDVENGLRVIQHELAPSQEHPGEWVIKNGPTVMRIREDQALGLRAAAAQALTQYMQSLVSALVGAQIDYENIKRGTSKFKRNVLGFFGGADDPGDFSTEVRRLFLLRDKSIKPLVEAGQFVEAFKIIIREKPGVEARVKAEHEYDMDLDKGYRRLATTMQVVQVALVSLVPIAGEAAIAGGAAAWAVGGTAVASGAGGAMLGETGRQVYTGEYDAGKVLSAGRQGAVIGASAVAPAITRSAGGGISRTLGTSEAFGEYSASIVVGGTQSTLGGGSFTEGAVGGGLGWGTGKATSPLGQGFTGKVAQTTAGAGVAALTGQDPIAGGTAALVGSFAKPPGSLPQKPAPTGKPTPTGGTDTIPGTGLAPKAPAPTPTGGTDTIPGTGLAPKAPAPTPTGGTDTIPGTGLAPKAPAPTPAVDPHAPTQPMPGVAPPGPVTGGGGGTELSIGPAPRPDRSPAGKPAARSRYAVVDEYRGRPPVIGKVGHVIQNQSEAAELYIRLNREGKRNFLGSDDVDLERMAWQGDAGPDAPADVPLAWIRTDGSVRFNFTKFQRPNLGGHTTEPFAPIPFERQPWSPPGPSSIPGGLRPPDMGGPGGSTLPGVGAAGPGRDPAGSAGGGTGTLPGVGAAGPAGGGGSPPPVSPTADTAPLPATNVTQVGTGIPKRVPGTQTGDTLPGVGPAGPGGRGPGGGGPGGGPQPGGGTTGPGGTATSRFARLPEYAGRAPLFGPESRIVATFEAGDEATALYNRLYREGQRNILSTEHPDATQLVWEQEGGTGTPPAAWVRNDGVVRFNRAKFKMPDLSDLHPQQYGPVRQPPKVQQPLMYEDLVRPPAGGVKPPPGRAVLPEYVGRPALFGPDSKIAHSINDRSEASALYRRFHDAQQQISQTMHEDATLVAWNQWGGEGTPPAAWVRTDGVVHFNLAKIDLPEAVADWYAQGIAQGTAIAPGSEAPK